MDRRKFLVGMGALTAGGAAFLGTGAFSRVESQRDVTIEVAEDPDAYLGLDGTGSVNSDNYVEIDDKGHLAIDIGENPNGGQGVNSDSFTWFDSMVQVCNQGKEDVGFYIESPTDNDFPEGIDATGPDGTPYEDEPRLQFYTGEAAGSGDDGTSSVIGEDNAVAIPLGECIELGVRTMTKGVDATANDQLFGDEVRLIADVDTEGVPPGTPENTILNLRTGTEYGDLDMALNEAQEGDTLALGPGEYSSFDITTNGLTLVGSGMNSTTINGQNHTDATDVTVRDLELDSDGGNSWIVETDAAIDGLRIENVKTVGNSIGIEVRADEDSPDKADGLHIENFQAVDNTVKGIYLERAHNATLRNITVDGIEFTGHENPPSNGIDINLKSQEYENITIEDTIVRGVEEDNFGDPTWNAAVCIKARDDPTAYDDFPATLDGVTVDNVTIKDSVAGLRLGEPGVDYDSDPEGPSNVTIQNSTFDNNDEYHVEDLSDSVNLNDVLNNNGNTFSPAGEIESDPDRIVPESS